MLLATECPGEKIDPVLAVGEFLINSIAKPGITKLRDFEQARLLRSLRTAGENHPI